MLKVAETNDSCGDSLSRRSTEGVAWVLAGLAVAEPIRVLITAILARLLTPADFGVVGMAMIFIGLLAVANDFGLQTAIVQRANVTDSELSTIFWLNLAIGCCLTITVALLAVPVASFFRQPMVAPFVAVLSLTLLISSLGQIQRAIVLRKMDFRTPAIANLAGVSLAGVVGIVMAFTGAGVSALVAYALINTVVSVLIMSLKAQFVPKAHFCWSEARGYMTFGGTLTFAELANFASSNIDNLLVGRVLGPGPLGVYALAFNLMMYPVRRIASTVAGVTMPAFARIQGDRVRYAKAFADAFEMLGMIVFPVLASAAVAGPDLVLGLYGPKWEAAVSPFRILCGAAIARALGVFAETGFKSTGRGSRFLLWMAAACVAIGSGAAVGIPFGVTGVAVGVALGTMLASFASVVDCWRAVGVRFNLLWATLVKVAVVGIAGGVFAWVTLAVTHAAALPRLFCGLISVVIGLVGPWLLFRLVPGYNSLHSIELLVFGLARRTR